MHLLRLFFVAALLLASWSCAGENPFTGRDTSTIKLDIVLPRGESRFAGDKRLAKTAHIVEVWINVYADDMDDIEQTLNISSDRTTASGSVEVPKGNDRTFEIECFDENEVLQYSGATTVDILEDNETVSITTEGHYPTASSITITGFNAQSVELSWTANTDVDFASYELVRAGTADDLTSSSTRSSIADITNQSITEYADTSVSQNSRYYYAVVVWDTDDLGWRSSPKNVTTPREFIYADTPLFIPDDGWAYTYYLDNSFAPTGAVVTKVEYQVRIDDTGDPNTFWCGDYEIYISSSTAPLASPDDELVYDNLGGWTDGGFDDDTDDDTDIWLNWRSTDYFNGESPNQYWGVYIIDTIPDDSGELDYVNLRIYYQVPFAEKVLAEGGASSSSLMMTGLDNAVARYEVRMVDAGQTTVTSRNGAGSSGAGAGVRIEKLR